jgi:hypothetical protein
MQPVTIPLLYCPFSPAINPQVKEAANHTDAWVASFNLHNGAAYRQYQEDNFAWLTARFYPKAELEQLKIANDFIVLLFALNDLLDDQQTQMHLPSLIEHFIAVSRDRDLPAAGNTPPVLVAWANLWLRIEQVSSPGWRTLFNQRLTSLLQAALRGTTGETIQPPTVAQYMEERPCQAGAHVSTCIIPIIEEISLPEEALLHPVLMELEQLSHKLLCWSSDLFSFNKAQAEGDDYNLVNLLQQERRLTLDEALLCAAAIHNTDMRRFVTLSTQIPGFDETTDKAVARYVEALRRHIRGNVDWSEKDSGRYSFVYGRS